MSAITRSVGLVAGLLFSATAPAFAASPFTQAFLTAIVPNVDFLDRSSRFALDHSKAKRIKDFAFSEAWEQTLASNAIYDWTLADANPKLAPTAARALDKTLFDKTSLDRTSLDRTPTGSTGPAPTAGAPAPDDAAPLPMGQEELDSLEGLEGKEFDALYKEKQHEALRQVATDYAAYIANGDDDALKALVARELPKVRMRIVALGRL